MAEEKRSLKYMEKELFLDELRELNEDGNHFCFILGSGASKNSGIPTGQDMMKKWRASLLENTPEAMRKKCKLTGVPLEAWERICQPEYKCPSQDYFALYDLRYGRNPAAGRKYLRGTMRRAKPSRGYHLLAKLMEETDHNVLITTNFDGMTEKAFVLEELGDPQMLGNPRVADLMQEFPPEIPLIAKVHGDAMLDP